MSHITDVILTTSLLEEDAHEEGRRNGVDALNEWFKDPSRFPGKLTQVDHLAKEGRAMQANVYVGAFNYLDIEGFTKAVAAAPWEDPECVQVFVKREKEERFSELALPHNGGEHEG